MVGSTECSLIWRQKTTPGGASISRLAPWTPPISDSGSTGSQPEDFWKTPAANDLNGGKSPPPGMSPTGRMPDGSKTTVALPMQIKMVANWPTPAAADLEGGRSNPAGTSATGIRPDGKKAQVGLPAVMKGTWPTPNALDRPRTDETLEKSAAFRKRNANQDTTPLYLGESMERLSTVWPIPKASPWATPAARDWRSDRSQVSSEEMYGKKGRPLARQALEASGAATPGLSATTARPDGSPNPAFPCWLQGYPVAWLLATPSAKPGKTSRKRSKTT